MYILRGKTPVVAHNINEWGKFCNDINNRRVAYHKNKEYSISTVFLGLEHGFRNGKPILWETLIYDYRIKDSEFNEFLYRYTTWNQAVLHHLIYKSRLERGIFNVR
jgi:hypothetical protein